MCYILTYWNIVQIHVKFDHRGLKKLIIENEFLSIGVSMVWQSRRIRQNPENCSNFNMEWVIFIRLHKINKKFCLTFSLLNSLVFISHQYWNPKSHCVPFRMEMNGEKNLRGRENAEKTASYITESSKTVTARKKCCCLLSSISCNGH